MKQDIVLESRYGSPVTKIVLHGTVGFIAHFDDGSILAFEHKLVRTIKDGPLWSDLKSPEYEGTRKVD